MSRSDLRQAALRRLQGDLAADPGNFRRLHVHDRAVVARRGLSRRHRKSERDQPGDTDRGGDPRKDSRRNRAHSVSRRLFLAKLASDHRKPDGLFVVTLKMGPSFVETLPVRKFHGIGPATARKMARLGIGTGLDLKSQTLEFLQHHFGKAGSYYYWAARGVDERPVRAERIRKSVGAENTFPSDL